MSMSHQGGFSIDDQNRIAEETERYAESRNSRRQGLGLGLSSTQSKLNALKARVRLREKEASFSEKGSGHWIRDDMKNAKFAFLADEKALTQKQEIEENYHQQREMLEKNKVMKERVESTYSSLGINASDVSEQDRKRLKTSSDESHFNAIFAPKGTETSAQSTSRGHDGSKSENVALEKKESPDIDLANAPLYKKLKKGDLIMAKYAPDGRWYRARILSAIQKGYINCKYDVKFEDYGNIETIVWQDAEEIAPVYNESDVGLRERGDESGNMNCYHDASTAADEVDIFGRDIRRDVTNSTAGGSACMKSLESSVLQQKDTMISEGEGVQRKSRFDVLPDTTDANTMQYTSLHHAGYQNHLMSSNPETAENPSTIKTGKNEYEVKVDEDASLEADTVIVNPTLLARKSGGWKSKK